MKKSNLINFFLMFLMAFSLCACCEKTNTIEKISSDEITATGEFEEGTTLVANKITIDSEEYNELNERVDLSQFDGMNLVIYDFSLEKDGKTIEAKKNVTITLPKPFMSQDGFETYHVKKDNNIEKLDTKVEGGNISFTTASFSTFIITGKAPIVNPTYNFLAYADTETQGKIIVHKEEKAAYTTKLEKGDQVFLTALPNEGYEFVGWYKGSKLSGSNQKYDEFKDEAIITFEGETIEIYARFMPINYKIIYDLNGGKFSEEAITSYNVESEDIILQIPEREYYRFDGWKYNDKVITKITKGTTGEINLVATWTQTEGLERTIEIIKDEIGEIELGTKEILTKYDYAVNQNNTVINGLDLKEEDGIVIIEYKLKSETADVYTTTIPSEVGEYLVRVRINQSETNPYYKEAVSSPKEFNIINRVIKTKLNVLGNYWYDKYEMGKNKIVKYNFYGANVLELKEVIGGEQKIYGYQNTKIPVSNLVFEEYCEKYTEVRIGSMDGIAIGRFIMYGMKYLSVNEFDENGTYTGNYNGCFGVCKFGGTYNNSLSEIYFNLVPNVEGYTDSEGNWICEEKTLDVYTYTHYTNDDPTQKNISFSVNFDFSRYNKYEDNPALNQYSHIQNDASNNINPSYYSFWPELNLKYDVEIRGEVDIYFLSIKGKKLEKIEKQAFMTLKYESDLDKYHDNGFYLFVLKPGAEVTVFNGKSFKIESSIS